jgi:hypothetical protein
LLSAGWTVELLLAGSEVGDAVVATVAVLTGTSGTVGAGAWLPENSISRTPAAKASRAMITVRMADRSGCDGVEVGKGGVL